MDRHYVVNRDGSHLRELPRSLAHIDSSVWSRDGKELYVSGRGNSPTILSTWKSNSDGSGAEPVHEGCGYVMDESLDSKYLLMTSLRGDDLGIFELGISDKKCTVLVPGITSFIPRFSNDGKYVVYTVSSRGEVNLYRLPWSNGQATGPAQLVMKLPFAFSQFFGGNAYDVARDLSKIVYTRPGGQFTYICYPRVVSSVIALELLARFRHSLTYFPPRPKDRCGTALFLPVSTEASTPLQSGHQFVSLIWPRFVRPMMLS